MDAGMMRAAGTRAGAFNLDAGVGASPLIPRRGRVEGRSCFQRITRWLSLASLAAALCATALPLHAQEPAPQPTTQNTTEPPASNPPATNGVTGSADGRRPSTSATDASPKGKDKSTEAASSAKAQKRFEVRVVDVVSSPAEMPIARCIVINPAGVNSAFCRYKRGGKYYRDDDKSPIDAARVPFDYKNIKTWIEAQIKDVTTIGPDQANNIANYLFSILNSFPGTTDLVIVQSVKTTLGEAFGQRWTQSGDQEPTQEERQTVHQNATTASGDQPPVERANGGSNSGGESEQVKQLQTQGDALTRCATDFETYVSGLQVPSTAESKVQPKVWLRPDDCPETVGGKLGKVAKQYRDMYERHYISRNNYDVMDILREVREWQYLGLAIIGAGLAIILVVLVVLLVRSVRQGRIPNKLSDPGYSVPESMRVVHDFELQHRLDRAKSANEQAQVQLRAEREKRAEHEAIIANFGTVLRELDLDLDVAETETWTDADWTDLTGELKAYREEVEKGHRTYVAAGGPSGGRDNDAFFEELEALLLYAHNASHDLPPEQVVHKVRKLLPQLAEIDHAHAVLNGLCDADGMTISGRAEAAVAAANDKLKIVLGDAEKQILKLAGEKAELSFTNEQLCKEKDVFASEKQGLTEKLAKLGSTARAVLLYLSVEPANAEMADEAAGWGDILAREQDQKTHRTLRLALTTLVDDCRDAFMQLAGSGYANLPGDLRIENLEDVLRKLLASLQELPGTELEQRLLNDGFGNKWLHDLFRAEQVLGAYFADVPECARLRDVVTRAAVTFRDVLRRLEVDLLPTRIGAITQVEVKERYATPRELTAYPTVKQVLEEWSRRVGKIIVDVNSFGFSRHGAAPSMPDVCLLNPAEFRT